MAEPVNAQGLTAAQMSAAAAARAFNNPQTSRPVPGKPDQKYQLPVAITPNTTVVGGQGITIPNPGTRGGSILGQMAGLTGELTGSSVTSSQANQNVSDIGTRINGVSSGYTPFVASYTDTSGVFHPQAPVLPNNYVPNAPYPESGVGPEGQQSGLSQFGTYNPQTASQDPRWQLMEKERERIEKASKEAENVQNDLYNARQKSMIQQQAGETGAASLQLAAMGAYGTTLSGVAYLQKLNQTHQEAVSNLDVQRAAAVFNAQQAFSRDEFDVALKQLDVADNLQKDYYEEQQRQIDNIRKFQEIRQFERAEAKDTINTLAASGLSSEDLPDGYLDYLDQKQGLPIGTSAALLDVAKAEYAEQQMEAQRKSEQEDITFTLDTAKKEQELQGFALSQAGKVVDLLSKTRQGGIVNIDGQEYAITGSTAGITSGIQKNDSTGETYGWAFDKDTGAWDVTRLPNMGAAKDGWDLVQTNQGLYSFNKNTNQLVPVSATVQNADWSKIFPEGSVSPFKDANGNPRVQCGAFVNDLTGIGVGDSWQSKQDKTDATIGTPQNSLQAGDMVVMKYSGPNGHAAVVEQLAPDPQNPNNVKIQIMESNYVKGKITHRWIDSTDPTITGYGRGKLSQMLNTGTDTNFALAAAPVTVSPGQALVNPETGKPIYTAPVTPEKPEREVYGPPAPGSGKAPGPISISTPEPLKIVGKPGEEEKKLSTADVNSIMTRHPGIDVKLTDTVEAAQQKIDNYKLQSEAAIKGAQEKAVPPQEVWDSLAEEAISRVAPRNEEVRARVIGMSNEVRDSLVASMPLMDEAIFNVTSDASAESREGIRNKIKNNLEKGQFKEAAISVKRVALERAEAEEKKAEGGRDMSVRNFSELASVLKQYKAAGGKMNLIEGNTEKLAGNLGKVRNKTQRVLMSRFTQLLIDYRRAYTGATFTPQESAQYEALLPKGTDDFDLSEAKILGLVQQMSSASENFYRSRLGDELYDSLYRRIKVMDTKTKKEGSIPIYEYDPKLYLPLSF